MTDKQQVPYGADYAGPKRPAWATWLIVALVAFIATVAMIVTASWTGAVLLGIATLAALVIAGVSALTAVRR